MEKKIHYKMHKVKKNWVAIALTTLALIVAPKVLGLEPGVVHADDVKQVVVQEPATAQTSGPGQQTPAQANVASEKEAEKATPADKVTGDVAASENLLNQQKIRKQQFKPMLKSLLNQQIRKKHLQKRLLLQKKLKLLMQSQKLLKQK